MCEGVTYELSPPYVTKAAPKSMTSTASSASGIEPPRRSKTRPSRSAARAAAPALSQSGADQVKVSTTPLPASRKSAPTEPAAHPRASRPKNAEQLLTKLLVYEASPVLVPANNETRTLSVSAPSADNSDLATAALLHFALTGDFDRKSCGWGVLSGRLGRVSHAREGRPRASGNTVTG